MLPTVLTIIVLGTVGCVIMTYIIDPKKEKAKDTKEPPQLPQRIVSADTRTSDNHRDHAYRATCSSSLPTRSPVTGSTGVSRDRSVRTLACGPRGLRPDQFPCCPYCRQRNYKGEKQLIVWDSGEGVYRCSRGHCFKKNGRIV